MADFLLHSASPLGILGWSLLGPPDQISRQVVGYALVFRLAWLAFTLARGPIVDFYPYPFIDIPQLGHARVPANAVGVPTLSSYSRLALQR